MKHHSIKSFLSKPWLIAIHLAFVLIQSELSASPDGWFADNGEASVSLIPATRGKSNARTNETTASIPPGQPQSPAERSPVPAPNDSFIANAPDEVTPEIQALARSLLNSPSKFFIFIVTQCEYEHYYGCKRGAQGALLERRGNDADLASLLVALLRASNYNPVYRYGVVGYLNSGDAQGRDMENWLGVTDSRVATYNGLRGFPATYSDGGSYRAIHRIWVQVQIGTSTYWFDPAFRKRTRINPALDVATISGYSRSGIESAAGGANGNDYVENLNETEVSKYLTERATTVVREIDSNYHGTHADTLPGKWDQTPYMAADGGYYTWHGDVWDAVMTPETWTSIPDDKLAKVTIDVKSVESGNPVLFSVTMPTASLQGRKLALAFTAPDSSGKAQLWLDDILLGEELSSANGASVLMRIALHHPHSNSLGINIHDQDSQRSYKRGSAYAITHAFTTNGEIIKRRQERLDAYRRSGLSDTSREVLTETLNIIGLTWMHETDLVQRMLGGLKNCETFDHHRFGRVAQESGYFVDVDLQYNGLFSMDGTQGSQAQARDSYTYVASALEHGVIEQSMGTANPAVSTVRLIRLANIQPAGSRKIFLASSSNWASVQPQLQGYGPTELADIVDTISNGGSALVPQKGNLALNNWVGAGFITKLSTGDSVQIGMKITGNLNGGYSTKPGTVNAGRTSQLSNSNPVRTNSSQLNTPKPLGADPVDLSSGDYYYPPTIDLSVGSGVPRGFVFSRSYHGNRRWVNPAGLGFGWTHNWHMRATSRSAYEPSLGLNGTPQDVAAALVACHSLNDLMAAPPSARSWTLAVMVGHWLTDQLQDNAVSVSLAEKSMQFVRRPDGAWQPPGGSTTTLTSGSTGWEVAERHGNLYKFDSVGRISRIIDLWGKELTVGYNSAGLIQTVTDAYGRTLSFNYQGSSSLESVSDSTGRTVTFVHDSNSDLTSITDPEGKNDKFVYDGEHRVSQVRNHDDQVIVSNFHDALGRVIEQRMHGDSNKASKFYYTPLFTIEENPKGTRKLFNFDSRKRHVSTVTTLLGVTRTSQTVFDGQDRTIEDITPLGRRTINSYDRYNCLLLTTDPEGKTTSLDYDDQYRLKRKQDQLGNGMSYTYNTQHQALTETNDEGETTTRTYNPGSGTLASEQLPNSPATQFGYNTRDEPELITHPNGDLERMEHNLRGDVTRFTDARGNSTTTIYNARRQPLVVTRPGNKSTSFTYDNSRNLESVTDPRGKTTNYLYNATGKRTETRFPDGTKVSDSYDERDWRVQSTDEMNRSTDYVYWSTGELRRVTDPELRKSEFTYDSDSRRTESRNNVGDLSVTEYDGRDFVKKQTDPLSRVTENGYDDAGKLITFKNRRGYAYGFSYDRADRLKNTSSPSGRIYGKTFNGQGLIGTATEPSGQTTSFTYDSRRRVKTRSDGVGTVTMTYDGNGNVTNVDQDGQNIARTFDPLDRVETYDDGRGHTLVFGYDDNSNMVSITYEAGKTVTMNYDDRNRMIKVTDWTGRVTTIEYWSNGRIRAINRPNGTRRETSWTPSGLLDQVNDRQVTNGTPIVALRTSYSPSGMVKDKLELPKWPNQPSPPVRTFSPYNSDNQITSVNGLNATHDTDGNLTRGPAPKGGSELVDYGWNVRNQLASGPEGMSYAYDAEGLRESYVYEGKTHVFVNQPNGNLPKVLIRIAPDGNKTYSIYGPELLYEIDGSSNQATYLHYDHLGSTIALTNDSGQVTGRILYTAYGLTAATSGTLNTPFLWQGAFGVQTDPNGLLFMRARYYHPWLGRFLSEDPMGLSAGPNLFAYANGNPITNSDPSGLWIETAWDIANVALGIDSLSSNLRNGNGLAAALDIVGIVIDVAATATPIVPGGIGTTLKGIRQADNIGDFTKVNSLDNLKSGLTHGHHSDPKFMGGDPNQKLTDMLVDQHKQLHKNLNDYLLRQTDEFGNHMRPQRGNPGTKIRENFTEKQRRDAMSDFYKQNESNYPDAARDFFNQHSKRK